MIFSHCHTIGKTEHRNDDFVLVAPLFRDQQLGIIGDFTSDSPQGASEACRSNLSRFVEERIQTWREMLLGPERILPLIVRHVNEWLADYRPKAQTTLIVLLWDLRSERCFYMSVGDSGLAVAGPDGLRFLREGDRQGIRNAAGFLPGTVEPKLETARVGRGETLLAFTDGLWENTAGFLTDAQLAAVLQTRPVPLLLEQLQHTLLTPATRKDDLSLILMTEEAPMKPKHAPLENQGDALDPQLLALIERHLEQTLGTGSPMGTTTPLERDLLSLLREGPQLEQRLLAELGPQIADQVEARVKRQLEEHRQAMDRQIKTVEARLEARIKAAGDEAKATSRANSQASAGRTGAASDRPPVKRTLRLMGGGPDGIPLWVQGLVAGLLVVGLGIAVMAYRKNAAAKVRQVEFIELKEQALVAKDKELLPNAIELLNKAKKADPSLWTEEEAAMLADWEKEQATLLPPEPPATNPVAAAPVYVPAPVATGFLEAMGTTMEVYTRQTADIQKALEALANPVTLPSTQTLALVNSGELQKGKLSVRFGKNASWVNERPIQKGWVSKIWLQAMVGAAADGNPGKATKDLFMTGKKPEVAKVYEATLKGWGTSP